ncbi:hypothetical protein NP511_08985 [Natrinema thermotolerans]|uniref:Uncharacterized protein n=1 Tax=Natrinema thermotolerans TaxID=121872 RepID=A0AAF0PIT9_9EURY|nr:hypothetical protein [Natrinema thermotolerans]WMT10239.1 hypothetical protein NP511_08985 [Natrinema thermotolerans]
MAQQSDSLEPFRAIELPDGSDPISKGIVRRIRSNEGTMTATRRSTSHWPTKGPTAGITSAT